MIEKSKLPINNIVILLIDGIVAFTKNNDKYFIILCLREESSWAELYSFNKGEQHLYYNHITVDVAEFTRQLDSRDNFFEEIEYEWTMVPHTDIATFQGRKA